MSTNASAVRRFIFLYEPHEAEVLITGPNKPKQWGFDTLAIGALKMDGSFASNRVGVLDLIGAQGMKAILRLTNTGPEVESLTEEKFATYAALIQQVRSRPPASPPSCFRRPPPLFW